LSDRSERQGRAVRVDEDSRVSRRALCALSRSAHCAAGRRGAARLRCPTDNAEARIMSYVRCLRGLGSGIEYPADVPMNLDPVDGRPVEMVLDLERLAVERPDAAWYDPSRR